MMTRLKWKWMIPFALVVILFPNAKAYAEITLPNGTVIPKVDFEKHVVGLFGKVGCNTGSCHGSFQGKNGFRLSLFGYEAERDGFSVAREFNGRRIDLLSPEESMILVKGAGLVEHAGGKKFSKDSWQYNLIKNWIEQGAPVNKGSGAIKSLNVSPEEVVFVRPGQKASIKSVVSFEDGTSEDLTSICEYRSLDDAVAEINPQGEISANRPGDTSIIIGYRGKVVAVRVLVPVPVEPGYNYPKVPENNYIDKIVFQKLKRLNIEPSGISDDFEFLRRITIDTIGTLPKSDEIRAFAEDKSPDKRSRKIEELLKHPMHASLWATKFSDITGNNTDALEQPQNLKSRRSQMWHDWLRKRVSENMPYDKIVEGILTATSRDGNTPEDYMAHVKKIDEQLSKGYESDYASKPSLDLFWRRQGVVTVDQWGEKAAAAFLGVRLECAQCHKHPFDKWTQAEYRAFANIFTNITAAGASSPELKKLMDEENKARRESAARNNNVNIVREVYVAANGRGSGKSLLHPETNQPLPPKPLGGNEFDHSSGKDIRKDLMEWMRSPENPYFAKSFVNRVWGHYFGVGIVDPVDDFAIANPASNPILLDALAKSFIESGYDLRKLEKAILESRTYQLTFKPNESNRLDDINFSHSYIRPMMAEVVVDVLSVATGVKENFGADAPKDAKAIEVGSSRVNSTVSYAFRIFGRPPRTAACDCERSMEPALPQKLYLMADTNLQAKIESNSNVIKTLLAQNSDDMKAFEELFLSTLGRFPNEKEIKNFKEYREKASDRKTAFTDTLWALLNTKEFIFNH